MKCPRCGSRLGYSDAERKVIFGVMGICLSFVAAVVIVAIIFM